MKFTDEQTERSHQEGMRRVLRETGDGQEVSQQKSAWKNYIIHLGKTVQVTWLIVQVTWLIVKRSSKTIGNSALENKDTTDDF